MTSRSCTALVFVLVAILALTLHELASRPPISFPVVKTAPAK